jgi:hypothetical protein
LKEKIIDFLLTHAGPSIVMRVKREILHCLSTDEESVLLEKIIAHKNIQTVINAQKPDGWIGNHFHGMSKLFGAGMYDNHEVGLRYLAEKGFPPENEYISKAVNSFLLREPYDYDVYRIKQPQPPGTDYTTTAFGIYFIRSALIVRAGHEYLFPKNEFIDIEHDIGFSFNTFANVLNYKSIDDIIVPQRKKLCFKPDMQWPCAYDLRALAHSKRWRNEKNISILADSVNRLFSFPQKGDDVYTYRKGQYYSPCFAFIHIPIIGSLKDEEIGSGWFDIMELFARCGIVNQVSALKAEYEAMLESIDDGLNLNINFSKHKKEISWGPYGGIALEEDWKAKIKKQCDLLFRVLLIIHHVESVANEKLI